MKKDETTLLDFIKYCNDHPDERFWQALRNWSGHSFILIANRVPDKNNDEYDFVLNGIPVQIVDTFYKN